MRHSQLAAHKTHKDDKLAETLKAAVEEISDDEGWARLGAVASLVMKWHADFDTRTYGRAKFSDLVMATNQFDVDRQHVMEGKKTKEACMRERGGTK